MSLKKVIEAWKGKPIEELLYELYVEQNLSMPEIAKQLCISTGIVCRWLSEYGIAKNPVLLKNLRK